jgi:hypothetical protein
VNDEPGSPVAPIVDAARADVEQLDAAGLWTSEDTAELDRAFECAATQALRTPRLAERSLALRRIARLVVPAPARPCLRRALAFLEGPLRALGARRHR